MAKIVTAFGTPHTPFLPEQVSNAPGQLKPEIIIVFTSDHFVHFFYNRFPAICVGVIGKADGVSFPQPNKHYPTW